jgi:hyaluronoglucosaminidase
MTVELGLIEGFYGKPWSWQARAENVAFLAPHGYRFYLYAPKADPFLRRRWLEDHPPTLAGELAGLAAHCRRLGVRFGIGLSPYESYLDFNAVAQAALARKLAFFDQLGIDDLAILFDDMRGDVPQLAARQIEIVEWVAARSRASRLLVCPTYYSDDPVLDTVFGERPADYLATLGQALDPAIEIFWTGEEVCSREQSPAHLSRVAEVIRRRPFLWDNYPVNDGQRMSQYLHLRGFTGRPAALAGAVAAHGINPAVQPVLTRVPALTLAASYRQGAAYRYGAAFAEAATAVLGDSLGRRLRQDLLALQDIGLDRLGGRAERLRERYSDESHPGAREIIAWLDGEYRMTDEIVLTQ